MLLYLDTSALAKLYVDEDGSQSVRDAVHDAHVSGTSAIAYVELRAALARRRRGGSLSATAHRQARRDIEADWLRLFVVSLDDDIVRKAGDASERYGLRAYDAVHLACAVAFQAEASEPVTFACWDRTLSKAAARLRLRPFPPT
ncbi:MAG: type II toxin-antitoxin system VapC family toxin [Vulcanimicrobiaceae bacterium]